MGLATTGHLDPAILSVLGPGFCGGLTAYSTFGYETLRLAEDGSRFLAGANIAISLLAGLGATQMRTGNPVAGPPPCHMSDFR
jgi:CrcB protein